MFSNTMQQSKVMTYNNNNGQVNTSVSTFNGETQGSGKNMKTKFNKQNAYMSGDKTNMVKKGTYIKKNWDENTIKSGKLQNDQINKLFDSRIKLPGSLPSIDSNNGNLYKMGYVYQDEIPNEEIISKTINTTDPYYTNFFLSRGGNNK